VAYFLFYMFENTITHVGAEVNVLPLQPIRAQVRDIRISFAIVFIETPELNNVVRLNMYSMRLPYNSITFHYKIVLFYKLKEQITHRPAVLHNTVSSTGSQSPSCGEIAPLVGLLPPRKPRDTSQQLPLFL
jgi:hypothetical protein